MLPIVRPTSTRPSPLKLPNLPFHVRKLLLRSIFDSFLANIHIVESLPKTRSGKVMRRLLRKLANDETDYGDTSTLLDPTVLESIRSVVQSDK